jgi:hypothetical protein
MKHIDHSNPNTFEIEDLAKLIKQVIYFCNAAFAISQNDMLNVNNM